MSKSTTKQPSTKKTKTSSATTEKTKKKKATTTTKQPNVIWDVAVGCYDGTVCGWRRINAMTEEEEDITSNKFEMKFAFTAHESCVRGIDAIASDVSSKLITCGADETVQTYDLDHRVVLDRFAGVHRAEVTAVAFAGPLETTMMMSGDADGILLFWKNGNVLYNLKGHKVSKVTSIALHPSHRLALTTAMDNSLRMWDLVHGKAAPRKKFEDFTIISCACWAPDGSRYGLVGDDKIVIVFDTADDVVSGLFKHEKRVNALVFVEDVMLASASDDGFVRLIGADGSELRRFDCLSSLDATTTNVTTARSLVRVRDVGVLNNGHGEASHIVTMSSDGIIRVYDLHDNAPNPSPVQIMPFQGRGTCMTCLTRVT